MQVTFQPGDFSYDQTSGDWIADKTFLIGTTGGIDGGGDKQFSVELSQPNQCQLGETSSATATIVRPEVDITSPGESSGTIEVPDDGSRVELDLQVTMDATMASQGNCAVLANVSGLQFWDSQTDGNQIMPDENGDIVDASFAGSGQYSGTLWISRTRRIGRHEPGRRRSGAATVDFQAVDAKGQHVTTTVKSATFSADVQAVPGRHIHRYQRHETRGGDN